jgi:outer membrane lipoprotein-sorting protein
MRGRSAIVPVVSVCLLAGGLSSCLARRRVITRAGGTTKQALLVADKNALMSIIARQFAAIHDFNATVDMVPALGSAEKSRITEYKDVRAYVLFRKPSDIRIIGLVPVVRNKAFDMVSNGETFKLSVPAKSRFIVGKNELAEPSPNKIENLRPQHFQEALLVRPVDTAREKPLLENLTDEDNAAYILHLVVPSEDGGLRIARTVWFNRVNLRLARQIIYDPSGNMLTDARYSDWQNYDNVPFPKHVEINRPHDEYAVVMNVVKMDINKGLSDDKFALEQPEGSTLQTVGPKPPAAETPKPAPVPPGKGRTRKK